MLKPRFDRDLVIEIAMEMWPQMLPHDYEPYWTRLGKALGFLDENGDEVE